MQYRIAAAMAVASTLALVACGKKEAPPPPPPPAVDVYVVQPQSVPNVIELPGRIEAVRTAEVRARTDGIVERRLYEEGTDVREGQPLFRIDPRDYRAQLQQAQAALLRAQASRVNAAAVVRRYQPLVAERAVSAQEYDTARATLRSAEADVADARAQITRANLQLSYTTVRAPIAGRVGRAEVTEGALVSAASATLLTRVDQMTPVYATFAQPNSETLNLIRQQQTGSLKVPALSQVPVKLTLENGAEYGPVGRLDFLAQAVEPTTGAQIVRGRFPNPERLLRPGQFVRGRIEVGQVVNGITVPQRAVQLAGEKASVTLVNPNGTTASRPIVLGPLIGGSFLVTSGLKPGDRVITEGWQKVMQPGMKVTVNQPGQRAAGQGQPPQQQGQQKAN